MSNDIVPAHLAVQAMRDNGYKNAAYAIAELMDNSIQAGATVVELLCAERFDRVEQRRRSRIHQVAVLDNGCGMDGDVLKIALQFGNGTHLTPDKQDGMGRFGMGLPNASISQCTRVEVWSWQNGLDSALYTRAKAPDPTRNVTPRHHRRSSPPLQHASASRRGTRAQAIAARSCRQRSARARSSARWSTKACPRKSPERSRRRPYPMGSSTSSPKPTWRRRPSSR